MDFSLFNALSTLEKPDGLIALPGAEHYVLAVRPDRAEALEKMRRLKGETEPVLLLGWDVAAFLPYIQPLPEAAERLIEKHWPGPLILMVSPNPNFPALCGKHQQVKILQPENQVLRDFLALNPGGVLATLCASRIDDPPATTAESVYNSFGDDVDFVMENDAVLEENIAPTVVSVEADGRVHLLRNGGIVLD